MKTDLQRTLERLGSNYEQNNFEMNADEGVQSNVVQDSTGFRQHMGNGNSGDIIRSLKAKAVGQLSINVSRSSANINCPLPYIIFGQNDFNSGYITTLTNLLGNTSTITVAGITFAVTSVLGNVLFTYTAPGPLVDVVTISLRANNNYVSFLSSMAQNFFKFMFCQLTISDATQSGIQFGQQIQFGELSSLGRASQDSVVLSDMIDSRAFRADKAELIVAEQPVTPSYSYASYIVAVASFVYTHGFFMSYRANLNKI